MNKFKKINLFVLIMIILSMFTACGRQEEQPGASDQTASEEYVYVPEYLEELHIPDSINRYETKAQGSGCISTTIFMIWKPGRQRTNFVSSPKRENCLWSFRWGQRERRAVFP